VKVVLAYSGGLDTSVAARSLAEENGLEVLAVAVDVGQAVDRAALEARAAAAGADLVVVDARAEFAAAYCWPALQANALYEGKYPLVSALARPLIAAKVVEVAHRTGAGAVAHGCTGKGNDQVRFEATFAALAPELQVLAPVRETALSRDEARSRAAAWGIPVSDEAKAYSVDENLWGRTVECGPLEDPWMEPPADAFVLTADPLTAPDEPSDVVVGFEGGLPVSLDGELLDPVEVIERIGALGGRHGFGRVDMVENRLVGIKSRELYEVPAALALIAAHRDLEDLTLERDLAHEKAAIERRWAELTYYGQWHGPLHASLRAFVASTQADVTGEVRLRLHHGACHVIGRRSPRALYDISLATYEAAGDRFDHRHAEGFVRLWSLPIRTWAARGTDDRSDRDGYLSRLGPPASRVQPRADPPVRSAGPPTGSAPSLSSTFGAEVGTDTGREEPSRSQPLWAGRFDGVPGEEVMAFTRSLRFDVRLARYDVQVTAAHVRGLVRAGLLTAEDGVQIESELERIADDIVAGTFVFAEGDEDVHSAVERALIERLGATGARVHAGRSRNDLVVTDLRLWTKDAAAILADHAARLAGALADRARTDGDAVMPGYTHLQRAQPILLGHHLLAHAFPLVRDADRLLRAWAAADVSALGAGALAGSTLPLDPPAAAADLGFGGVFDNSMDAVSDRDFALEFLAACSILAVHLSRLGEDVVLWTSQEFGFARMADRDATGSSMMPQKRNPDVAELVRGKAGRVLGDLVALVTALKGLPLSYARDLQEDKEAVFDAFDTLAGAVPALTSLIRGLTFDRRRMAAALDGTILATDLAELLVTKGMPFREAHGLVGRIVAAIEGEGRALHQLSPGEWAAWSPHLADAGALLDPGAGVTRRDTHGGTSPASVKRQLGAIAARLAELSDRLHGASAPAVPAAR
jgi:argininosuccinate lyase/argininosuccinate synthase